MGYVLGIDLGTTFSAAAVNEGGRAEIFTLGQTGPAIPSVVLLRADGEVLVGEAAERRAMSEPGRVARQFKRRLGDPVPLILGGTPYGAETLYGHLLAAIVTSVVSERGAAPDTIVLSHPASWGPYKKDLLQQAVRQAGLGPVELITEPQAAAVYYAGRQHLEAGDVVAVYDFGGGTFDASILRVTAGGFELLGEPEGMERLGGIDFDEAIFSKVRRDLAGAFEKLDETNPSHLAAVAQLRQQCRAAKEALSADTDAVIPVLLPDVHDEVVITRAEFEEMIRPRVRESIAALERAVRSAGMTDADLTRILLVGGSSRIPLIAREIEAATGRPVAVDANPKYAIALGASLAGGPATSAAPAAPAAATPPAAPPPTVVTTLPPAASTPAAAGSPPPTIMTTLPPAGTSPAAGPDADGPAPAEPPAAADQPPVRPGSATVIALPGTALPPTPPAASQAPGAPGPTPTPPPQATPPAAAPQPPAAPAPAPAQPSPTLVEPSGPAAAPAPTPQPVAPAPTPHNPAGPPAAPPYGGPPAAPPYDGSGPSAMPVPPATGDQAKKSRAPLIMASVALVLVLGLVAAFVTMRSRSADRRAARAESAATVAPTPTTAAVASTAKPAATTAAAPATTAPPATTAATSAPATTAAAGNGPRVTIVSVSVSQPAGVYWVEYTTNFTPVIEDSSKWHIHFYFDTVTETQAGVPGTGPWILYDVPSPFRGYKVADRPRGATKICASVATHDHRIVLGTQSCWALPN